MNGRMAKVIGMGWLAIGGTFSAWAAAQETTASAAESAGPDGYAVDGDWAKLPEGQTWDGATSWVAADGEGQVVVLVRTAPYFRVFTRDGEFVEAWGEEDFFRNAHSVTFDADGNLWATDAAAHVIYQFSPDGELLQTLGSKGEAGDNGSETLFNQPNHVAIAPDGELYITDGYVNSRVVQFTEEGEFVRIIGGEEGSEPGQLMVPHGVALDSQGRILVNDSGNQRVSVFSADGEFVESWPFPSRGGIAIDAEDRVYVSDVNAGSVNVLKDGELIESIPLGLRPHGLALDSDGALYVSDSRGMTVIKITRE